MLQKHALLENDIALQAERVQNASAAALKFANGDSKCRGLMWPLLLVLLGIRTLNRLQAIDLSQGWVLNLSAF